jgi:hypothetical protein
MANTSTNKATSITKQEAVERALKEKGWDAKPVDLKPFIKERYGLDMTAEHITTCKSKARQKAPAKKSPAPNAAVQPAPQPAKSRAGNSGFSLEDLQAVKGLIGKFGAAPLRTLIDLLTK